MEFTLSSSCFRSDSPLSRQVAALAHLDPSPFVIWYSGLTALFLFVLARAAPAYLPTAFSVALRPLSLFQQTQYVQIFSLKPEPFFKLFAGLGSTNKSAIYFLFSCYFILVLSSPLCPLFHLSFYLNLSDRSGRNCLLSPPVLSGYNGSPDTRFSRGTKRLISWPDGERYLRPLQFLLVSLLFLLSTLLFSRTGGALSHRNSSTRKFLDFLRGTYAPSSCSLCLLSGLCCNGHSLLLSSYFSRIGRTENSSCSACVHSPQDTSKLILHFPATDSLRRSLFGDSLSLYDLWFRLWGVARLLRHHGIPPCPYLSEGVG